MIRATRVVIVLAVLCVAFSLASRADSEELAAGFIEHPAVHHAMIERAADDMPRADTASVAELDDGRLLVVYHKYEQGKHAGKDRGACRIWSKTSADGGRTWASPRMLVDLAPGDMNVQAPALLKLDSGDLLLACLRAHGGSSSTMCTFHSTDDGRTWRQGPTVWTESNGQWLQGGASAIAQLESGRLLLPCHGGTGDQWKQTNSVRCYYSDDRGGSWQIAPGKLELPKRGAMEASVAELGDGTLVMSLRTQLGGPFLSRSLDSGETWSEAKPSGLEGGESCTCLRRIPGSDDLLLLWNNSTFFPKGHHHYGERTPLTAAVSADGGQSWRVVGNLAENTKDEYTNLDCTFTTSGAAVITFMHAAPAWNRTQISLRAVVVEKGWFYAE